MELNEKQAKQRLAAPNNLANRLAEFRKQKKLQLDEDGGTLEVRPARQLPRLPTAVRSEIADKVLTGYYTNEDLAKDYGVSAATISRIRSQVEELERQDAEEFERKLVAEDPTYVPRAARAIETEKLDSQIKQAAIDKMMLAMGLITQERLEKMKATDMANVAASMAKVHETFSPRQNAQAAAINLVIYSPEVRAEESYKTIEIKADSK